MSLIDFVNDNRKEITFSLVDIQEGLDICVVPCVHV